MKRLFIILFSFLLLSAAAAFPQDLPALRYVDASSLTIVGKLMDTPNPWWRLDTARFEGFTPVESNQVRCCAGMAVAFRTDSPLITIRLERREPQYIGMSGTGIVSAGFDLYIREGGQWIWAENVAFKPGTAGPDTLIDHMDGTVHECLLYLPVHSELYKLELGFAEGSLVEPLEQPFRHRIVFCGSSFTHGGSSSRPGMTYPSQFERMTGLQVLNLGCGGNGKLQPHFAEALAATEADAFVLDQFSNPSPELMRERFFPFLETLRKAHPGVPIIFQQTIVRERVNFDTLVRRRESEKTALADSLMKIAVKRYPDVYYVKPDASGGSHEHTVDGTHPDDYGYYLWARSIEKPVRRILRRYGIK